MAPREESLQDKQARAKVEDWFGHHSQFAKSWPQDQIRRVTKHLGLMEKLVEVLRHGTDDAAMDDCLGCIETLYDRVENDRDADRDRGG